MFHRSLFAVSVPIPGCERGPGGPLRAAALDRGKLPLDGRNVQEFAEDPGWIHAGVRDDLARGVQLSC